MNEQHVSTPKAQLLYIKIILKKQQQKKQQCDPTDMSKTSHSHALKSLDYIKYTLKGERDMAQERLQILALLK